MAHGDPHRITTLIGELRQGNDAAREELVTLVYPELRRIAAHYMRQERPDHTLRTTGLVNEMYVRLFGTAQMDWQSRAHFFAAVAREMRHILVDYARARDAKKRPGPSSGDFADRRRRRRVATSATKTSLRSTRRCRGSSRSIRAPAASSSCGTSPG